MAGTLVIDQLKASSGVLATQNGMTGIAKAWVNFQGGAGNTAGTINGSFNVSSITVNGTGNYTINFTTAMANANYSFVFGLQSGDTNTSVVRTAFSLSTGPLSTTQLGVVTTYATSSGSIASYPIVTATIFA